MQIPWLYILQNRELFGTDNMWVDPDFDSEMKKKREE